MYNQQYIDSIGEENFKRLIDGKISYRPNINDINSKNQQINYAFQHFLIKAYINGYNRNACASYLKQFYNDFYNKPYLFCDSPLIKNDVLQAIFGDSEQKQKIISYRDNYYNAKDINQLLSQRKNSLLSPGEKDRYYAYLTALVNTDNKQNEQFLKNEIEKIINTDFDKLSDMQLKFYCQYVSKYATENRGFKTTVMIGKDEPRLKGYQTKGYIFINKDAIKSLDLLTKTVCHETRHSIQSHEAHGKDTLAGFELAQMELFCKYLNSKTYDSYHKNYRYSTIELDAEQVGHWSASVFFTMFKKQELAEKVRESRRTTTDERNYYSFMLDENNKALTTDEFIVANLDKIIMSSPKELNNYPVLKNMYNQDGTKKSFVSIMSGRMRETVDNRGIYDNYINYGIANNELNNIPLNNANRDTIRRYAESLSSIYRDYAQELNNYYQDNTNKHNPKQVAFATNYKLMLSYKLLSYVDDNYDTIINAFDDKEFNHTNPIYWFIHDLRDLNIDDIKNDAIKNNPEMLKNIKAIKEKSDNISRKFNASYMKDKLGKLPSEVLSSSIVVPEIGSVNFQDYFINIILPKMDGHKKVIINNKEYYVGDLIVAHAKMVNEELKSQSTNKTR